MEQSPSWCAAFPPAFPETVLVGSSSSGLAARRAQVHVKRGEAEEAFGVFQGLIDRVPSNLRFRSEAAEAMLRLKQAGRARTFAEAGLEAARKQNDRDGEQQMMDLVAAAKKQGG
jgi:hypothetical protein